MKKVIFLLLTSLSMLSTVPAQMSKPEDSGMVSSQNGKVFLFNYYQQTFDRLQKSVSGLSEAQLHFKPAADRWSVSQCLEHIVLTERMLFDYARQGMEGPANPDKRKEVKASDEDIVQGITDRSHKATAAAELTGKGKYTHPEDGLNDLMKDRKSILAYIDSVSVEDLRNHISDSPFGAVDAYQSFLFVAGHTARHTLQINEVMADKNFPEK